MRGRITAIVPVRQNGDEKKGGFGFIRDEEERDRFFHARDVRGKARFDELRVGDEVELNPLQGPTGDKQKGNGLRAEKVTRV